MQYAIAPERGFSDFFFCEEMIRPERISHIHSHIEFVFVLEGDLDITISGNSYLLSARQMAVVMPYEPHSYTGNVRLFVLACPPEYLPEYRQILTDKVFSPPFATYAPVHQAIIEDIIADNFTDNLRKKAMLYYAVAALLQQCDLQSAPAYDFDLYRRALVYITDQNDTLSLRSTATALGVNQSHLSRVLNSGDKPGFSEILNSMRVYAARRMIEQDNLNISEAAMAAGFGSIRNFHRIFKAHFGCNPSDIKKAPED